MKTWRVPIIGDSNPSFHAGEAGFSAIIEILFPPAEKKRRERDGLRGLPAPPGREESGGYRVPRRRNS
jgi:hypothetical protein